MRDLIMMDSRFVSLLLLWKCVVLTMKFPKILEIRLFVLGHYFNNDTVPGSSGKAGTRGNIRVTYERLKVAAIMSEEIKGPMLISSQLIPLRVRS